MQKHCANCALLVRLLSQSKQCTINWRSRSLILQGLRPIENGCYQLETFLVRAVMVRNVGLRRACQESRLVSHYENVNLFTVRSDDKLATYAQCRTILFRMAPAIDV